MHRRRPALAEHVPVALLNTLQVLIYLIPTREILFLLSPFYGETESQGNGAFCPSPHSQERG